MTMNEWQPIETAPTGRNEVLVFVPKPKRTHDFIVQARNLTGSQWWVTGIGEIHPTHWMPLPPPPLTSA
jgi:hypothetical protein